MEKIEKITILSTIVLIGFVVGVFYHYTHGFYFNHSYPHNSFLYLPSMAFTDYSNMMIRVEALSPYKEVDSWINYFPMSYVILWLFSLIKPTMLGYAVLAGIFFSFLININRRILTVESAGKLVNFQNVFVLSLLTYPVLLAFDRGNVDLLLFVPFAIFAYLFKEGKYLQSALLLAFLCSTKIFFWFFLLLFLVYKKFKEFFLGVTLAGVFILAAFLILKGTVADQLQVLVTNLSEIRHEYLYNPYVGSWHHASLYSTMMTFAAIVLFSAQFIPFETLITSYGILTFFATLFIIFLVINEKKLWKQLNFLTLYAIIMPIVSVNYKYMFLFIPLWLFVSEKEKSKYDKLYCILFGLLLIPKLFVQNVDLGLFLNPLIVLVFIGFMALEQFQSKGAADEN